MRMRIVDYSVVRKVQSPKSWKSLKNTRHFYLRRYTNKNISLAVDNNEKQRKKLMGTEVEDGRYFTSYCFVLSGFIIDSHNQTISAYKIY